MAAAHDINMAWVNVATTPDRCVDARGEIDHPDESNYRHRFYWTVLLWRRTDDGSCNYTTSGYLRLKGGSYVSSDGYQPYTVCATTVGDGLGEAGYVHETTSKIELHSPWDNSGLCGLGHYKAKTWGYYQNAGWKGGAITSNSHGFK